MKYRFTDISIKLMLFILTTIQITPEELYDRMTFNAPNDVLTNFRESFHVNRFSKKKCDIYEFMSKEFTYELWIADFKDLLYNNFVISPIDGRGMSGFELVKHSYLKIYKAETYSYHIRDDRNIKNHCFCVLLKFRVSNQISQQDFYLNMRSINEQYITSLKISWNRNHNTFKFLEPEKFCKYYKLMNLEIANRTILFVIKRYYDYKKYCQQRFNSRKTQFLRSRTEDNTKMVPFFKKDKRTGRLVEYSLDNMDSDDLINYDMTIPNDHSDTFIYDREINDEITSLVSE